MIKTILSSFTILLCLVINNVCFSQTQNIEYSGKVIDSFSGEPIPLVLVYLKNNTIGNVTNEEGEFTIKIPKNIVDTLIFSHLGYSTLKIPLGKLKLGHLEILKLEPENLGLEEVQVTAKRITANEIMERVNENRKKNFTTNPFQMEGYYKHKLNVDGEEKAFVEVALDMVDKDYQPYKYKDGIAKEEIILKGIRKRISKDDDYPKLEQVLPAYDFLNNLLIINRARRGFGKYISMDFSIDTVTYFQGILTYVILAIPKGEKDSFWKVKMYINSDDYAILRYESAMDIKKYGIKVFDQNVNDSIKNKSIDLKRIIEFRKQGNNYYPFYYQVSGSDIIENLQSGIERIYEYKNELLLFNLSVTDIKVSKSKRTKAKLIDKKFKDLSYDPAFWANYNYLKLTDDELETTLISDFESNILETAEYQWNFSKADTLLGAWNELKSNYDINHYNINININPEEKLIKGKVTFNFHVISDTDKIQFDLNNQLKISSIQRQGKNLKFTREHNAVFVHFDEILKTNQRYQIEIAYSGTPLAPNFSIPQYGAFVWTEDQEKNRWFQSICQGSGANGWWPVKDHFLDKPDSVDIVVTVPNDGELLSNGFLISKTPMSNGKMKYHWKVSYPILSYNVAINYGQYTKLESSQFSSRFDLSLYKLKSSIDINHTYLEKIENIVKAYEHFFGPYPFPDDGLKVVETPYPMEHQSCITIGDTYNQELISHEIAHEWWGNSISCTDYADLWIHESFATYAESLFIEASEGFGAGQKHLAAKKRQIRYQKPLVGNYGVNDIHYDISDLYNKGALIWNTLRSISKNDSIWFATLKELQKSFRYKNITSEQLIAFFSKALDIELYCFRLIFGLFQKIESSKPRGF